MKPEYETVEQLKRIRSLLERIVKVLEAKEPREKPDDDAG